MRSPEGAGLAEDLGAGAGFGDLEPEGEIAGEQAKAHGDAVGMQAGTDQMIEIMAVATGSTIADIEGRYDGVGYGQFKQDVAESVVDLLAPIQERYADLRADEGELRRLLRMGAEKARAASEPTIKAMYEAMGFVTI